MIDRLRMVFGSLVAEVSRRSNNHRITEVTDAVLDLVYRLQQRLPMPERAQGAPTIHQITARLKGRRVEPAAGPAVSTALVIASKNNRPKRITITDRVRRRVVAARLSIGHPITDLLAWLAAWPGWDRRPPTRKDAWRRSEVLHTTRVPADSQLLIFFWEASNYTDRFLFFALAILVDLLTRKAPRRVRNALAGPLYHFAQHPTRRWVAYLVFVICLKAAS